MQGKTMVVGLAMLLGACGEEPSDDGSLFSTGGGITTPGTSGSDDSTGDSGDPDPSTSTMTSTTSPTTTSTTMPPPDPDTSADGPPPPPPMECGPTPVGGADPLIDDLELEAGQMEPDHLIPSIDGRVGFWFTYNDGSAGGTQEPPDPFTPSAGGADGTDHGARTWGNGFDAWGAGMAVSLNNDFSGDCPYDVSAYTGIGFWMQGTGSVRMHVSTQATVPPELGGTCNAAPGMCHDDHGVDLAAAGSWTYHEVRWNEMTQQGWGQAAVFDPGTVMQLHWQVPPGASFDVWVDELVFLTD
ncbi:hypothetical protein [Paraliomyxa miuraensis]|uniref:hypothetical protein n=1 Tax=Paraliomyxa miuraensis TaxID=376150 RepID=UPI00225247F3|nr:hypothetical protein [Paraliomyxa miuraensis]MCX4240806.1 hypothetical protein [Paraliomyxa miuraensis]